MHGSIIMDPKRPKTEDERESSLDSLKSVFNVCMRKPSLAANRSNSLLGSL